MRIEQNTHIQWQNPIHHVEVEKTVKSHALHSSPLSDGKKPSSSEGFEKKEGVWLFSDVRKKVSELLNDFIHQRITVQVWKENMDNIVEECQPNNMSVHRKEHEVYKISLLAKYENFRLMEERNENVIPLKSMPSLRDIKKKKKEIIKEHQKIQDMINDWGKEYASIHHLDMNRIQTPNLSFDVSIAKKGINDLKGILIDRKI